MEQKCVVAVVVLSGVLAIVVGVLGVIGGLASLGLMPAVEHANEGGPPVWTSLAFLLICLLGGSAGSALKSQANQIAELRRQVADALGHRP